MKPLSSSELLTVWELGSGLTPARLALLLIGAACPETPMEELARLSIGQRDSFLMTLRERTFGAQLVGTASCPLCNECLQLTFCIDDIRVSVEEETAKPLGIRKDDYEVNFRLPTGDDLVACSGMNEPTAIRSGLLERCLLQIIQNGKKQTSNQLPQEVVTAVIEKMAWADPQADVQLSLDCPGCQHAWKAVFDIVSFFWHEIDSWARRMLREVHIIASTYGWREDDILAMSAQRRQSYLEMVNGS